MPVGFALVAGLRSLLILIVVVNSKSTIVIIAVFVDDLVVDGNYNF